MIAVVEIRCRHAHTSRVARRRRRPRCRVRHRPRCRKRHVRSRKDPATGQTN